jgi:hypothetical protein
MFNITQLLARVVRPVTDYVAAAVARIAADPPPDDDPHEEDDEPTRQLGPGGHMDFSNFAQRRVILLFVFHLSFEVWWMPCLALEYPQYYHYFLGTLCWWRETMFWNYFCTFLPIASDQFMQLTLS